MTRKGVGYVPHEELEQDIEIAPEDLNTALNGDEVEVEIIGRGKGQRARGRVLHVIKRATQEFVGTLERGDSGAYNARW